eukprot:104373-Rhodomonas_salina.1
MMMMMMMMLLMMMMMMMMLLIEIRDANKDERGPPSTPRTRLVTILMLAQMEVLMDKGCGHHTKNFEQGRKEIYETMKL